MNQGLKWSTNAFSYEDCIKLCDILWTNFNLKTSIQRSGLQDQYVIYVFKESIPHLRKLVQPYIVNSILYKLN